jgi:hypothetical protein
MTETLIAKWLEDRGSLTEQEAADLVRLLEVDPALAKSVKHQLALDHLLSLRLGVDRRNFEQQVAQRIRNASDGATFERSTLEAVQRAKRRRSWRSWAPEAAVAAVLLAGLLLLLPRGKPTETPVTPASPRPAPVPGLRGEYFQNRTLSGPPLLRIDPKLNFEWSAGRGPVQGWRDVYSARWTGTLTPAYSEPYTIKVRNDDAVRMWIDGKLVIDDWNARLVVAENRGQVQLEAGRRHELKVEYYNGGDRGVLSFAWSSPSQKEEAIPPSAFSH